MYNAIPKYVPHSEIAALAYDKFFDQKLIANVHDYLVSKHKDQNNLEVDEESMPSELFTNLYSSVGKLNHDNWEYDILVAKQMLFFNTSLAGWNCSFVCDPKKPDVCTKLTAVLFLTSTENASIEIDSYISQKIPVLEGRLVVFPSFLKYKITSATAVPFLVCDFVGPKFK